MQICSTNCAKSKFWAKTYNLIAAGQSLLPSPRVGLLSHKIYVANKFSVFSFSFVLFLNIVFICNNGNFYPHTCLDLDLLDPNL